MPALPTLPLLNGYEPSWADFSATVSFNGAPLLKTSGLKELSTGTTVTVGASMRNGQKFRRTSGSTDPSASMTVYRSEWQNMLRILGAVAPLRQGVRKISLVSFDMNFWHTPPLAPGVAPVIYEVRVKGARILGRDFSDAEGDDPNEVALTLDVMSVQDIVDGQAYEI